MTEINKKTVKRESDVKQVVIAAMFVSIMAVGSWISIPGPVPFTLQTFAVFTALLVLGGKNGTLAICVYIMLGALGLPVFSGFKGGPGVLFGTTGGYIVGFIFMGLAYTAIIALYTKTQDTISSKKISKIHKIPRAGRNVMIRIITLLVGLVMCYAFGTAWFVLLYSRTNSPISVITALNWCVFPFVIPDLIKLALAVMVSSRINKFIR